MTNEQSDHLDETIDRVAAAITSVAHDAGFANRIADRLDDHARTWWSPRRTLMAAALAMVIVIARVASDRFAPAAPVDVDMSATRTGSDPFSSVTPEKGSDPFAAGSDPVRAVGSDLVETASDPTAPRFITYERLVPQLDALPSPEPLHAADATSMSNPIPLTVQPVELAPLDLANLPLSESDAPENPKE